MKILKTLVPALFASLLAVSSASALPAAAPANLAEAAAPSLVQVQHRGSPHHGKAHRGKAHRRHTYRPGGRYKTAPRGYRRYGARPHNWKALRCVMVGPVWFCP